MNVGVPPRTTHHAHRKAHPQDAPHLSNPPLVHTLALPLRRRPEGLDFDLDFDLELDFRGPYGRAILARRLENFLRWRVGVGGGVGVGVVCVFAHV